MCNYIIKFLYVVYCLVSNQVPALLAGVKAGCVRLCRVSSNIVWSHMATDTL